MRIYISGAMSSDINYVEKFHEAVFMLSDWTYSKGAMIEYELAVHMNKRIFFEGNQKSEQALGLRPYKPGGALVVDEGTPAE